MPPLEPDEPPLEPDEPPIPPLEPEEPLVPVLPVELPVLLGLLGFPVDPDEPLPLMPPFDPELPIPSSFWLPRSLRPELELPLDPEPDPVLDAAYPLSFELPELRELELL